MHSKMEKEITQLRKKKLFGHKTWPNSGYVTKFMHVIKEENKQHLTKSSPSSNRSSNKQNDIYLYFLTHPQPGEK